MESKNWFKNIKEDNDILNDYSVLDNRFKSFDLTGREDAPKITSLKTRIDNLKNNLDKLDESQRFNAEDVLDQLMVQLSDFLDKEMKPKLIKTKGKKWAFRGIKGEQFENVKKYGLLADWDYEGAKGFEKALFFTDNETEANRYGEIILRFPWPQISILANRGGIDGKYYLTNENVDSALILWKNTTINQWEKI